MSLGIAWKKMYSKEKWEFSNKKILEKKCFPLKEKPAEHLWVVVVVGSLCKSENAIYQSMCRELVWKKYDAWKLRSTSWNVTKVHIILRGLTSSKKKLACIFSMWPLFIGLSGFFGFMIIFH